MRGREMKVVLIIAEEVYKIIVFCASKEVLCLYNYTQLTKILLKSCQDLHLAASTTRLTNNSIFLQ